MSGQVTSEQEMEHCKRVREGHMWPIIDVFFSAIYIKGFLNQGTHKDVTNDGHGG